MRPKPLLFLLAVLICLMFLAMAVHSQAVVPLQVQSVSVLPSSIVAGQSGVGTVTLTRVSNEDTHVALGLSSEFGAVPARVRVPAGQVSATFPILITKTIEYSPVDPYEGIVYANYGVTKQFAIKILSRIPPPCTGTNADYCTKTICYHCVLDEPDVDAGLLSFYRKAVDVNKDPFVVGDARFVLWRASGKPDCSVLDLYHTIAVKEERRGLLGNFDRRLEADAVIAFTSKECGLDAGPAYAVAAKAAKTSGRKFESEALAQMAAGTFVPQFGDVDIKTSITVPAGATTMTLGASYIEVMSGAHVGSQVDRVSRDWISMEIPWWDLDHKNFNPADIIPWGEGVQTAEIASHVPRSVINPLTGTLVARHNGKWYAPDETGVFRFWVLDDKVQYPTTHVDGEFGWIEDTHGISALVSQSLEFGDSFVIGCGDSEGKAKAAYYLATKGVNVMMPPDRYESLLLGYTGTKGKLIGTAPMRRVDGGIIIGAQPITFSLKEQFIVEDTTRPYPLQYYDAPARYFRKLSTFVPQLNVTYVKVDDENQLPRLFEVAKLAGSNTIAVRISTSEEDEQLVMWLRSSILHRAILFHSSLFPYVEQIFSEYRTQVTFGDLRPTFGTEGSARAYNGGHPSND